MFCTTRNKVISEVRFSWQSTAMILTTIMNIDAFHMSVEMNW